MSTRTDAPAARVLKLLEESGPTVVALSGGVDSSVLTALAAQAIGAQNVLAVTTVSPAVPASERRAAGQVAGFVGVAHLEVETHELSRPEYRRNSGDRCYHCRIEMFETLWSIARRRGYDTLAYGAIVDDIGDDRPGMAAADGLGVRAPLLEAGLNKRDVRTIANNLKLPVADKPAAACLASRIPVGTTVTPERLARVERAEEALARLGLVQFRVRHHGEVARLELDAHGERLLRDPSGRQRIVDAVRDAGFRFVTVDLEGYRAGGLTVLRKPRVES